MSADSNTVELLDIQDSTVPTDPELIASISKLLACASTSQLDLLSQNLALLNLLSQDFPGGIFLFNERLELIFSNSAARELLGGSDKALTLSSNSCESRVNEDDGMENGQDGLCAALYNAFESYIAKGADYCVEHRSSDGKILELRGMPLSSGQHTVLVVEVSNRHDRARDLEVLLENFPGGICVFDRNNDMILHNQKLLEMLEYSEELFRNGPPNLADIFRFNAERGEYGTGDVEKKVEARMALVSQRLPHVYDRQRPNGAVLEVRGLPVKDGGFVTTYIDVTEQRERAKQVEVLIDNFPGAIAMYNRNLDMTIYNDRLIELLDYPKEMFEGKPPNLEDIFKYNANRGEYGEGNVEELVSEKMKLVSEMEPHQYERLRPDGKYLEIRGVPLEGGGFVTTYLDVTERRRNQALLAHMAHHDELTGLPNRALFKEKLDHACAQARRGYHFALLYLDLNKFKPVNDTYGHAAGDELLKAVANRIEEVRRDTDTLARLGGDEFAMVQTGIMDRKGAQILAERIIKELTMPFDIEGRHIKIGTSIGIAYSLENGCEPDPLLRMADEALYAAKSDPDFDYCFFTDSGEDSNTT